MSIGNEDVSVAIAMNDLGVCLRHLSILDEAEDLLRHALRVIRKLRARTDPEVGTVLWNLADVLYAKGDNAAAEPLLREALTIVVKHYPKSHPNLASLRSQLGRVLVRQTLTTDPHASLATSTNDSSDELRARIARLTEAEGLLRPAYEILSAAPNARKRIVISALEGMIELCDAWHTAEPSKGYDAKAAEWRARLVELRARTQPTSKPVSPAASQQTGS